MHRRPGTCTGTFDLAGQNLEGTIPVDFGLLTKLTGVKLGNNKLTGEIPPEIADMVSVGKLDLSNNQLSGSIPAALGKNQQINKLLLNNNQLTGEIPEELSNMNRLWEVGRPALQPNLNRSRVPKLQTLLSFRVRNRTVSTIWNPIWKLRRSSTAHPSPKMSAIGFLL